MSAVTALIALLVGACSGAIAALCGVGGGLIMVPAFVKFLGLDQKHAVATSLAVIVPTALVTTVRYARADLVKWPIVLVTALGASVVAFFATDWLKSFSSQELRRIFACLLILVGLKMLFEK